MIAVCNAVPRSSVVSPVLPPASDDASEMHIAPLLYHRDGSWSRLPLASYLDRPQVQVLLLDRVPTFSSMRIPLVLDFGDIDTQ